MRCALWSKHRETAKSRLEGGAGGYLQLACLLLARRLQLLQLLSRLREYDRFGRAEFRPLSSRRSSQAAPACYSHTESVAWFHRWRLRVQGKL